MVPSWRYDDTMRICTLDDYILNIETHRDMLRVEEPGLSETLGQHALNRIDIGLQQVEG